MSHTDIIIITGTLFISSTIGIYAVLIYINLHTRPPINSLIRSSRDIELQYIEPSRDSNLLQPQQVHSYNTSEGIHCTSERITSSFSANPPSYNTLDLLQPQQVHISERVPSYIPTYSTTDPFSITNSCFEDSLNLQTFPEYYIHCCLEDSINLNYIFLIIIFIMVVYSIIIKKYIVK
jgi:hypothetical protein